MDEENGVPAPEEQEKDFEAIADDQRKRAEKAEAELKDIKAALEQPTEEEPEPTPAPLPSQEQGIQFDSLAENLSVLRNLDDAEVDELQTEAKALGVDPVKFAKSSAWKAHLDALRVKSKAEATTPEPSHRTAVYEGKSFAEVVAGDNHDEKQAAFIAQRDALLKRGDNQMM